MRWRQRWTHFPEKARNAAGVATVTYGSFVLPRPRRLSVIRFSLPMLGICLVFAACSGPSIQSASTTSSGVHATTTIPSKRPVLLVEPDDTYQPVDTFIASAQHSVDMTMYELTDPTAEAALVADAARGVDVRVLFDQDYSGSKVNGPAYATLSSGGVHVGWSNPSEIFHQKTITVDHETSLIMTGNLTAKYYSTTRDFGVFDTDSADVAAIESTFAADFAGGRPAPAPSAIDLVWSPGSQSTLVSLISAAQHSVVAEAEEMDSKAIEEALEEDAERGVTVDVVMTDSSDWNTAFGQLEAAGVHVVVYRGESPLYIHAKVILVDGGLSDQQAFIGSENFSTASMKYNRELGLITTDPTILKALNTVVTSDVSGATPWT